MMEVIQIRITHNSAFSAQLYCELTAGPLQTIWSPILQISNATTSHKKVKADNKTREETNKNNSNCKQPNYVRQNT